MHVKVFGIQRTGTNYLNFLIVNNMKLGEHPFVLNDPYQGDHKPGWKHEAVRRLDDVDESVRQESDNKAIILIKNPYTWYKSILKWIIPAGKKYNFDGFGGTTPTHVFARYNNLYRKHKEFLLGTKEDTMYTGGVLIRYEDLILDPKAEFNRAATELGINLKDKFIDTKNAIQSATFTEEVRNYYLAQKPIYGENIVREVTAAVDWELMNFYGYKRI